MQEFLQRMLLAATSVTQKEGNVLAEGEVPDEGVSIKSQPAKQGTLESREVGSFSLVLQVGVTQHLIELN